MLKLVLALVLTGVALVPVARAAEPIRVGFMAPLSGIFAQAGNDMLAGLELAYPLVSQFWTYEPDDFLKRPGYTRDHPPVKP